MINLRLFKKECFYAKYHILNILLRYLINSDNSEIAYSIKQKKSNVMVKIF